MQPTLNAPTARRLLRESAPIAAILAVWSLPTVLVWPATEQALLVSGLLMAGLYAVVRGSHLATDCSPVPRPTDLLAQLRENGRLLAVAGVWFLAAQVVGFLEPAFGPSGADFVAVVLFVLNGTGAGTVLIYAIAVGRAGLAGDDGGGTAHEPDASHASPVDG